MRTIFFSLLIAACINVSPLLAESDSIQVLNDIVVVTASRIPSRLSQVPRSLTVISSDELTASPGRSLEDFLARVPGVDVRQRGAYGVQADVSVRGGSFEQTMLLLDGVKVGDPQTGHHNLDLPLAMLDVERLEILKGPGSRLFGPNGMAGVINVITRPPTDRRLQLQTSGGGDGFSEQQLAIDLPVIGTNHRLAMSRRSSTGFRENTEFDIRTMSYRTDLPLGDSRISLSGRYVDKEFGAYRFYSDMFPDEWEATKSWFLSADAGLRLASIKLTPRLFWRQHEDDFVLDRNRPDWYRNNHTTDHYGAELEAARDVSWGKVVLGAELATEQITSSNLGDHTRNRGGIFIENRMTPATGLTISPGAWIFHYSDWGWEAWPGFDIGYELTPQTRFYFSTGHSYRIPTYTDLYYTSPANLGNPDLRPEEAWTYELGAYFSENLFSAHLSVFQRDGSNLIDWGRSSDSEPWQVMNISNATTRGFESGVGLDSIFVDGWFRVSRLGLRYVFLDSDRDAGQYESKYLLDHLAHELVIDVDQRWFGKLHQNWRLRYLNRYNSDEYFLVDSRLSGSYSSLNLFVEVMNLFDRSYVEIGTIPMPGRWFRIGAGLSITGD